MKRKSASTLILCFGFISTAFMARAQSEPWTGFSIVKGDSAYHNLLNANGAPVAVLETLPMDMEALKKDLEKPEIPDGKLVARVLSMHADKKNQLRELLGISRTMPEIEKLLVKHAYLALEKSVGGKELRKLKKKKRK